MRSRVAGHPSLPHAHVHSISTASSLRATGHDQGLRDRSRQLTFGMVAGFNPGKRVARMPDRVQNLICRCGGLLDKHRLSARGSVIQIVRPRIAILLLSLLGLKRLILLGELCRYSRLMSTTSRAAAATSSKSAALIRRATAQSEKAGLDALLIGLEFGARHLLHSRLLNLGQELSHYHIAWKMGSSKPKIGISRNGS